MEDPARGLEGLRTLLEAPSPAVLITYRRDGSADMSPVWFRYTGEAFEVVVAKNGVGVCLSASAAQVWDLSAILPVTTRSDG
jgi:hypothetical protein